jgi:flagella synthesis protein FlgN
VNTLLADLCAEISCLKDFLAALNREEKAMLEGRFHDLAAITEEKTRLMDRMAELDVVREATQCALGHLPGSEGGSAAAHAAGEATEQAWKSLMQLAEEARSANQRNGSMVYSHLDFTQRALHFLQASTELFYGPDGVRKPTSTLRGPLALG